MTSVAEKAKAEALQRSITHWEENRDVVRPEEANIHSGACALCTLYEHKNCAGCPVAQKALRRFCEGTPWRKAAQALTAWGLGVEGAEAAWREAAQDEVDWLRSLEGEAQ